ncbi:MAG: hypothetical protein HXY20_14700 [Acidobacteria bacterium]|nr:hypothetical protein [Acidobacteriota bacterium]
MNSTRSGKVLVCAVVVYVAFALGVLLAEPGFAQQPAPKAPVPKPSAKAAVAATTGAAAEQLRFKGIFEPVSYSEDIQFSDVFFVNTHVGWVAGAHGTLLKTSDGGASWAAQLGGDPQSLDRTISDLRFVSETTGWATQRTSSHTNLLHTTDGETWEQVGTIAEHYTDYSFMTETEGVFATGDKVYRTKDAGRTWRDVCTCQYRAEVQGLPRNLSCQIQRMHFPTTTVGYGLAYTRGADIAAILKTEDGGATWNLAGLLPDEGASDGGIFFTDESNGVVRVHSGKSYITADGGQTWKGMIAANLGQRIRFADPEVGWSFADLCVGMGCENARLSFTTDRGRRWTTRSLAFPAGIAAFSLPRRDLGYVVGAHGMIYRYRVVPATEEVAKAIPAPAMPVFDSPLDEQVEQLQAEVAALEEEVKKKAGGQGSSGGDGSGGGAAAETSEGSLVDACCREQVEKIEATAEAVASEVPKFTGRYRSLNLIFTGLRLVGELFGQAQGLKDSLKSLREARDATALSAALTGLTGQVTGLVQSTKVAFQSPGQPAEQSHE